MTAKLRQAFKFFLEHAGYATPPGRAACALELAKAEIWANDNGYTFNVVDDPEVDTSWMSEAELQKLRAGDLEAVGVILLDTLNERPLTSLWGIVVAESSYLRVVKAELVCEYLSYHKQHLTLQQGCF